MPAVCQGEVEIEDDDFTMEFERFIIRENNLSFQGSGYDFHRDGGEFRFDGNGKADISGQYRIAPKLDYQSPKLDSRCPPIDECYGTIVIEEIRLSLHTSSV